MNLHRCGKVIYRDEAEARRHLKEFRKKPFGNGTGKPLWQLDAYRCERCDGWHIGHNHKKQRGKLDPTTP